MANFSAVEQDIKNMFLSEIGSEETLNFKGSEYHVECVDKPSSSSGEPKTDVYVKLSGDEGIQEVKISVKKRNADFLENKMTPTSAQRVFGNDWQNIIYRSILTIREQFNNTELILIDKKGKAEAGSITVGWRFEILDKPGGRLSGRLDLNAAEVYKGTLLDDDKKNALINGSRVPNSGVAEYIVFVEDLDSLEDAQAVLNALELIDDYITRKPNIYFACKAANLRTLESPFKIEANGTRCLSVYVDWKITDSKLDYELKYDNPLDIQGHQIRDNLICIFRELGLGNVTECNDTNTADTSICFVRA